MARRRPIRVWVQHHVGKTFLYLRWTDPATGKQRSESTGTTDPHEAEEMRAKKEYELRQGIHAEPSKMSWAAFSELYIAERLGSRRPATARKARGIFAKFGEQIEKLAQVDERALSRYAMRLREGGNEPATIVGHLAYLKAALRWAARQKLIPAAPYIDMPRVPKHRRIRTVADDGFARILLACPDDHWRRFVWCAWHTGMRRNELLSLRWETDEKFPWVDFAAKRIYLPARFNKSGVDQWVPVHPDLLAMLDAARQESGWVFPLSESAKEVSRQFTAIATAAGVKAKLHDLRRTFGTRFAPHVPAQVLQRLLRHGDIRTTLEYYADLTGVLDAAITAADKPSDVPWPPAPPKQDEPPELPGGSQSPAK